MRAEWLKRLTPGWSWQWIDTDPPLLSTQRLWRSMAFRHQIGKAVGRINAEVSARVMGRHFDLAWVDKGVFLTPETNSRIRRASGLMVHFTPDMAFGANHSRHFEASLRYFDLVVTTKSFELPEYARRSEPDKILLTTQGFDPLVHFPQFGAGERRREVVFVGLAEPHRERCIASLLERNIVVRLAGRGWMGFLRRWGRHRRLVYEAEDSFGRDYAELFSRAWIGLGLISKRFPELHTTRTFEIPACGALLATERTRETTQFFSEDEALFFDDDAELATRVETAFQLDDAQLAALAGAGRARIAKDGRDYQKILAKILSSPQLKSLNYRFG